MSETWYSYPLRVPYKDTDQMSVVHHGNYIFWFEAARVEFMRHYDLSYFDLEKKGFFLPVIDVNLSYKKSAHFDDRVVVFTKIENFSPVRITFYYEARRLDESMFPSTDTEKAQEPHGELLTFGTTEHMWMNEDWKPARIHKALPDVYQSLKQIYG